MGNTSACAEKSYQAPRHYSVDEKYLRVRGEEVERTATAGQDGEIPPRARRRGGHHTRMESAHGNTSACAEKRLQARGVAYPMRKYLRVRGEELPAPAPLQRGREIPPRARRRVWSAGTVGFEHGNTSACAEKSAAHGTHWRKTRKYLRVRGEESSSKFLSVSGPEIPPRARRRGARRPHRTARPGNTSACAEKRLRQPERRGNLRKYLRVRGEEWAMMFAAWAILEIPPRARRRATPRYPARVCPRNTSACAEKSYPLINIKSSPREIPPRARRRGGARPPTMLGTGNTSACAEKS